MNKAKTAAVIGAGFAGCEAAKQLSARGIKVRLYEMKPKKFSPAHSSENFAELVCSNSFKAIRIETAAGLLKKEMEHFDSLTVKCAYESQVPAGGALAVDREMFSKLVTSEIEADENIDVIREEVTEIPDADAVIIAAGPLVSEALAEKIAALSGGFLSFYDAAAPIITADSIDMENAFFASRYDRGGDTDYINCPMNKEEYEAFYNALIGAETAELHSVDSDRQVYEGCMPIEIMAKRGPDTIRFGPMKPVGLRDPRTGHRPWAVLQLRKENAEGSLYNLVGFQTNLKFGEQKRVFSMIPALKNAEFVRYGVMHRNTFINSPKALNRNLSFTSAPHIFAAGQITGVEGYMESAACGIIAGINAANFILNKPHLELPLETMLGALVNYTVSSTSDDFQPMGASFGLLPPLPQKIRDKKERYRALAERSLELLKGFEA
ncbi:MAG: methylenetetrahydrofolate--tRNA-(uracil(54)-C(5))-methyltransferase (FADH(2)-oxidizing) TrmFO [Clostridiales bacterium]|jgi:methylenetetrahydrofolate--tRNA-(uracil-5-)-methyltransferase|nr:methylenetetrahydrofolate--tRNA-(uracil(54)-C(5))-methyltransferase (FADH(2)-oxidizing) TrmFO [Clostridiales bacterium]